MRGQWRVTRPSDNIARMKFRIRPILLVFLVTVRLVSVIIWPILVVSLLTVRLVSLISHMTWNILIFGSTYVCDLCNEQSSFYITDMKDLYEWPVSTVLGLGKVWVLELKQVNFIGGTSSLEVFFACLRCCVLLS